MDFRCLLSRKHFNETAAEGIGEVERLTEVTVQRRLLNWSSHILLMSELMQLLMGISINLYLPAKGTAGLARILVSG